MKGAHNGRLAIRAYAGQSRGHNAHSPASTGGPNATPPANIGAVDGASGAVVVIEVSNTGPAIPPDILPHVFDAFESSKSAVNGEAKCSGLGLALCRDLIEENDGTISVSSDAESGTKFIISLPRVRMSCRLEARVSSMQRR
jgi:signal transduction histidine kinase